MTGAAPVTDAADADASRAERVRLFERVARHPWLLPALIGAAVVAVLLVWWVTGRESTDDARIAGHIHPISSRVSGTVATVHVVEQQQVAEGDVLFELDRRDYEVAQLAAESDLAAARALLVAAERGLPVASTAANSQLGAARADHSNASTGIALAEQRLRVAESDLNVAKGLLTETEARHRRAAKDRERLEPLAERDEVSQQEWDRAVTQETTSRAAVEVLRARVQVAEGEIEVARSQRRQADDDVAHSEARLNDASSAPHRIAVSEAQVEEAKARVHQAEARLERSRLDLEYTHIRAPAAGVISRKRVEVGQIVQVGQPLLALVGVDHVWAMANFKETQLRRMRPGQRAVVEVDAYPGHFEGTVAGIGAATTSSFSLLPPENSSGNFVKVVQRVPVKIELDDPVDPERPLRPGMSIVATVRVRGETAPSEPGSSSGN